MNISRHGDSRRAAAAYTLAEVMMAVLLVSIGFVSLYAGMFSGFAFTKVARENLRATQIMLERMEGIRLYNWEQLTLSNWIPTTFTSYYYPLTNGGESRGIPYSGKFTITNISFPSPAPTYASNMRLISVQVWWTNSLGTNQVVRTRQMQTYVGRIGLQSYIYNN
jgi:Tfp pilus assembly protein PilV